jgi:hypothetical protein
MRKQRKKCNEGESDERKEWKVTVVRRGKE